MFASLKSLFAQFVAFLKSLVVKSAVVADASAQSQNTSDVAASVASDEKALA